MCSLPKSRKIDHRRSYLASSSDPPHTFLLYPNTSGLCPHTFLIHPHAILLPSHTVLKLASYCPHTLLIPMMWPNEVSLTCTCHPCVRLLGPRADNPPSRATSLLSEIIAGVTLYFDKALGNNLLYRFERAQYVEQKRSNPDKGMSEIYGAEHLLRLFGECRLLLHSAGCEGLTPVRTAGAEPTTPVNFGPFIAYTNIDTESLNILREYINDIMK